MKAPTPTPDPVVQGHLSVLPNEVLAVLRPERGGLSLVDCTFGWGGHSRSLLAAAPDNKVLALDCDPEAAVRAAELKQEFGDRFRFELSNFAELDAIVTAPVDGILFDFGLASSHYDNPERGFSFRHDGPTDMRLNPATGISAAEFFRNRARNRSGNSRTRLRRRAALAGCGAGDPRGTRYR
ncbi:MAG: 16S rRNA (cytosine(1402)-N(4))-methyltransferase [Verrucomicrobia bacterium]|nr:16S rRNA (cytosine(1402)-N(4))-methyltransferase [Verrucomicrobiota bacterium]